MSTPTAILQHPLFDTASIEVCCPGCDRRKYVPLTKLRTMITRSMICGGCSTRFVIPDIDQEVTSA